jgi:Galactokinase
VMPLALPHTAVAAVSRRSDGVLRLHSADIDGPVVELRVDELVPRSDTGWAAYPAGVVWALREAGHAVGGADIHLASTVPTGAGLSSSAALEVVTALALDELYGLGLSRPELALLAQRAENDFVGVPCGVMDQTASACCTEGHALHLDCRDLSIRQVPFDLTSQGLELLVVDTRVKHALGDGRTRSGARAARRARGSSACPICATSPTKASTRPSPVSPTSVSAATSAMSSPTTTGWTGSSPCSTRATSGPSGRS